MKKFLIGIIIVLTILLIGQLIYFNYRNNYYLNNTAQNNEISENILNNNANGVTTNLTNNFETNITTAPNVITPNGMSTIAQNYTGEVRLSEVEEAFYTFVHTNINEIYQLVQKKSINQILQQYDLNTSKINSMHIYSAEDFLAIARQVLQVGNTYSNSSIDKTSYNPNEDGYTTFYTTFNYSNVTQLRIKVYVANSSQTMPNIKFGSLDE